MNRTLTIVKTAFLADQMGGVELPQVALAGRSNVGKSSLINCLAGRRQLAKTSATPGKTRSLNYYEVAPQGYCLVDLPGYGYARCSKAERDKWAELIGPLSARQPSAARRGRASGLPPGPAAERPDPHELPPASAPAHHGPC
jgi:Predicted GTPase